MEACETLKDYAHLLALVREKRAEGADLETAVREAVSECIEDGVLADYLMRHRAEVEDMLFTIEDQERAMRIHEEAIEREATERGLAKGMAQGLEQGMAQGLEQGMAQGLEQGMAQGLEQGMAKGLEEGRAVGRAEERDSIMELLRANGVSEDVVSKVESRANVQ